MQAMSTCCGVPQGYAQWLPQAPTYNAVKIDVHDPVMNAPTTAPVATQQQYAQASSSASSAASAATSGAVPCACQQMYQPIYQMPVNPVMTAPTATASSASAAAAAAAAPQLAAPIPMAPIPVQQMPYPAAYPVVTPMPIPAQTVVQPQQSQVAPEVSQPAPAVATATAAAAAAAGATSAASASSAATAATQSIPVQTATPVATSPVVPSPVVVDKPVTTAPNSLEPIVSMLGSSVYEEQFKAMDDLVKLTQTDQNAATAYIDNSIYSKLINILNANTETIPGPTEKQLSIRTELIKNQNAVANGKKAPFVISEEDMALANELSPFEKAESNKLCALITMAHLGNVFNNVLVKERGSVAPLADFPCAAVMVDAIKNNPSPKVRETALAALTIIQRPEYKNELQTVYQVAQTDENDDVCRTATEALKQLNAMPQ